MYKEEHVVSFDKRHLGHGSAPFNYFKNLKKKYEPQHTFILH